MYDQPNYMATAVIHERRHINWRLVGAYAIAAVGVGAAIACLLLLLSYKNAIATQMAQMSQAIQREQSANTSNASNYKSLNDRLNGMDGIVSAITAYNMVCTQDLEGQNGPVRFYFACSSQRPGN